jgi:uncharacterized membrane protein YphA (DoxX/SURF4 family)
LFAATLIALGITGFVNGDFALVWQQVPPDLPGRTLLAHVCAALELLTGAGLLWSRTTTPASRLLFPFMVLWVALLQIPHVIQSPLDTSAWGGIGEIGIMLAGTWCLFAMHAGTWETRHAGFVVGPSGIRAARWLLVLTLPMIGTEVIVDAVNMGNGVMQPWLQTLPWPMAWACLTGAASIATSLALLFGIWPRFAATMEAAMIAAIGIVYWGPDLYTGRTATTAFIITILIAAGTWVVAESYRGTRWFATGQPVWKV